MKVTSTRVIAIAFCSRRCQAGSGGSESYLLPRPLARLRGGYALGVSQRLISDPRSPDAQSLGPIYTRFAATALSWLVPYSASCVEQAPRDAGRSVAKRLPDTHPRQPAHA